MPCQYRGNISPPLDARWHLGGWTSHFEWPGTEAFLDVFGIAPRARSAWQEEMLPPYAHPHVVADMKRTAREKDWPFVTALGVKLVDGGDVRGWLHIYDLGRMRVLLKLHPIIPDSILRARPLLQMLVDDDPMISAAMRLERTFWEELSKRRVRQYEQSLRSYVVAVRKASAGKALTLQEDHELRVMCAGEYLPPRPINCGRLEEMVNESRSDAMIGQNPDMGRWLPDVIPNFTFLVSGLHSQP